jgi:hypothetical protein
MVKIHRADQAGGGVAVVHPELAPGAVAVGVDRGLGHAELAGDLLRRQVLVDQAQTFALSGREQADRIDVRRRARGHLT